MDNILEILVPLIFAAIYFFGNMFGKSKDGEDSAAPSPSRRDAEGEGAGEGAERQRRIQEEIRRKIMERRRATGDSPSPAAPAAYEQRERREEVEARHETREVRKETREAVHGRRDVPPPLVPTAYGAEPEPASGIFSWDESDNAYENSMQAQLKQIEETKRRAEKLKKQAAERRKTVEEPSRNKRRTGGYFTGTVRESLQDPRAARMAFIYGEVLGKPISFRKGESSVPGLS
jgi:hypothetical protein